MKHQRLILFLSLGVWLIVALYGLIFSLTYVDEAKYLIKGWLITTGQVGYYTTPEFFYQHMPGVFLWYGFGQKIFGPSLLIGRVQSLLVGLLVFWGSFSLGKKLGGVKAGLTTLALLSLAPAITLYYSAAVPQSLVVLFLILGFIFLHDGFILKKNSKFFLATICFGLIFVIRENFLFTLILYLGFLGFILKNQGKQLGLNLLLMALTLGIFILPGIPGTIEVLRNFPFIGYLLPSDPAAKQVLTLYWKGELQNWNLYLRAIKEFGIIFHAWILIFSWLIYHWISTERKKSSFEINPITIYWSFFCLITIFNLVIHTVAAVELSPRAITSYFSYVAPLIAIIFGVTLTSFLKTKSQQHKAWLVYLGLLILVPIGLRFTAIFDMPSRLPDLRNTYASAEKLRPLIKNKEKILWLTEPMSLYLTGRISYYPLINHTGFYKPSTDTATVANLGFWNQAILERWLEEADLVVIDENKLKLLEESAQAKPMAEFLKKRLNDSFSLTDQRDDIWPGQLKFYQPKNKLSE